MRRGKLTCLIAVALVALHRRLGHGLAGQAPRRADPALRDGQADGLVRTSTRCAGPDLPVRPQARPDDLRRRAEGAPVAAGRKRVPNDAPGRFGFGLGAVAIAVGGGRSGWEVAGRLVRPSKARGTVRAFDTHTPLGGGETANCRSGLLEWSASAGGTD